MPDLTVSSSIDAFMQASGKPSMRQGISINEVFVSDYATSGNGTSSNPWIGWDTAITWQGFTKYRFNSGYYQYNTSPNFLFSGIELIGEPGTYIVHAGTGDGFVMDAGSTVGGLWIQNVKVENICVLGKVRSVTGSVNYSNGSPTITGNGTAFTTELAVGDSLTFGGGASTAQSYIISSISSNTSLTINRNAVGTATFSPATYTKTQNGFYLRGVRNGLFDRLSCKDVAKSGIWTEACVTNSLRMFRVTFHEPTQYAEFLCRPQYGIVFSGRGADWSTTWNVEEPVIEGTQIYGIWLKSDTYGNSIINGTSEENKGIGIQIDGPHNTIIGTDTEGNGGDDCVINSTRNLLLNFFSTGTVTITGSVGSNFLIGGYYQTLVVQSGSYLNRLFGATINGSITDSGNSTIFLPVSGSDLRSRTGINRRMSSSPASGTISADCKLAERIEVSMSGTCTISAPSNPTNGDILEYVFHNNSGSSQTFSWNSIFVSTSEHSLPTSLSTGKTTYVQCQYSSFWSKWHVINVSTVP